MTRWCQLFRKNSYYDVLNYMKKFGQNQVSLHHGIYEKEGQKIAFTWIEARGMPVKIREREVGDCTKIIQRGNGWYRADCNTLRQVIRLGERLEKRGIEVLINDEPLEMEKENLQMCERIITLLGQKPPENLR